MTLDSSFRTDLVGHLVENPALCGPLPGEEIRCEVTSLNRMCLELAVTMLDGRETPAERDLVGLKNAAAQWARDGLPIDTILRAFHEGFRMGGDPVASNATGAGLGDVAAGRQVDIELLGVMTSTVALAYVGELSAVIGERRTAAHTLTAALLSGQGTSAMARECGVPIADRYAVLAVAFPPHQDERNPTLNSRVVARRKLRRVQTELADLGGEGALSLLSPGGGTILIPAHFTGRLDYLVARLSFVAEVEIVASCIEAAPPDIPTATDHAHQLLDLAQRLHRAPGLYRLHDLALEYQLTRPGPGYDFLLTLLDPLAPHPELLETVRTHIENNLNRRHTARDLHIHMNTVDYRLKRVGQLTGFDPMVPSGLWYVRSALIVLSLVRPDFP